IDFFLSAGRSIFLAIVATQGIVHAASKGAQIHYIGKEASTRWAGGPDPSMMADAGALDLGDETCREYERVVDPKYGDREALSHLTEGVHYAIRSLTSLVVLPQGVSMWSRIW